MTQQCNDVNGEYHLEREHCKWVKAGPHPPAGADSRQKRGQWELCIFGPHPRWTLVRDDDPVFRLQDTTSTEPHADCPPHWPHRVENGRWYSSKVSGDGPHGGLQVSITEQANSVLVGFESNGERRSAPDGPDDGTHRTPHRAGFEGNGATCVVSCHNTKSDEEIRKCVEQLFARSPIPCRHQECKVTHEEFCMSGMLN